MATIHKRTLTSGEVVWELTHGTGRDRVRIIVSKTREEAQEVLKQFERQIALHGEAPGSDSLAAIVGQYDRYLQTNRRERTVARYMRVIRTFTECFMTRYYPDLIQLRQVRPAHIEEYKRRRSEGELIEAHLEKDTDVSRNSGSPSPPVRPKACRRRTGHGLAGWVDTGSNRVCHRARSITSSGFSLRFSTGPSNATRPR